MRVRGYEESDLAELERWHAQSGFAYRLPDFGDWRMNPKLVLEAEGKPVMAAALRLTSEAYLWLDKDAGSPRERWEHLLRMHEAVRREAQRLGYEDVHAFVPPEVARGFHRRLVKLGWMPEEFRCYWRKTAAEN